jgi:hypothetical protein
MSTTTDLSRLKRELASRHLYESARGKQRELAIVSGFLKRLQLANVVITASERPERQFVTNEDKGRTSRCLLRLVPYTPGLS